MNIGANQQEFVQRFGGIYEHSPWIAEQSWPQVQGCEDVDSLAKAMQAIVENASQDQQLALIRAHPDLAGRIAVAGELTSDSASEQSSAGLDQCSDEEFAAFQSLNTEYVEKFSFPFVMAVRGCHRQEILAQFGTRLHNSYVQEFATALQEIHKIARLRLEQYFA